MADALITRRGGGGGIADMSNGIKIKALALSDSIEENNFISLYPAKLNKDSSDKFSQSLTLTGLQKPFKVVNINEGKDLLVTGADSYEYWKAMLVEYTDNGEVNISSQVELLINNKSALLDCCVIDDENVQVLYYMYDNISEVASLSSLHISISGMTMTIDDIGKKLFSGSSTVAPNTPLRVQTHVISSSRLLVSYSQAGTNIPINVFIAFLSEGRVSSVSTTVTKEVPSAYTSSASYSNYRVFDILDVGNNKFVLAMGSEDFITTRKNSEGYTSFFRITFSDVTLSFDEYERYVKFSRKNSTANEYLYASSRYSYASVASQTLSRNFMVRLAGNKFVLLFAINGSGISYDRFSGGVYAKILDFDSQNIFDDSYEVVEIRDRNYYYSSPGSDYLLAAFKKDNKVCCFVNTSANSYSFDALTMTFDESFENIIYSDRKPMFSSLQEAQTYGVTNFIELPIGNKVRGYFPINYSSTKINGSVFDLGNFVVPSSIENKINGILLTKATTVSEGKCIVM